MVFHKLYRHTAARILQTPWLTIVVDVCVVGGGMAGVCAALAAARHGASVALVQDRPMLGGNASSEIRMHICGADSYYEGETAPRLRARETGILEELRLKSLSYNGEHNISIMDLALYDTVRSQSGLQLFLNAQVVSCETTEDGGFTKLTSCTARELTSDRILRFEAQQFIDASGDGNLAYVAGTAYTKGREASAEFDESLAPAEADDCTLGHTILFDVVDVGRPVPFTPPSWAMKFGDEQLLPFRKPDRSFGFWWVEWGGTMDTVTDTEAINQELIAAALGIWDYMKNRSQTTVDGKPQLMENYALNWFGFLPGRRESRRFLGDHILTENDLRSIPTAHSFDDQIAYGGWPIDTHPPLGFRDTQNAPCQQIRLPRIYQIPLRSCYCRDFNNLYLAGRNISASHITFASTRIMATCASIGQAVGTAAALGLHQNLAPQQIVAQQMPLLQQQLLADGVFLANIANTDPHDLAQLAHVTASSILDDGGDWQPGKVIDGYNHPEPVLEGDYHAWRSASLPAWLELSWDDAVEIDTLRLVCDTDFDSQLMLTQEPCHQKAVGPVPRAVTLKHFSIEAHTGDGTWVTLASIDNNYQRQVRLQFPVRRCQRLRINCLQTWGAPFVSVLEVRCYGEL
ncbi:MAG: FAD-dependent oxidoreductase [Armatimonadota bacterium]